MKQLLEKELYLEIALYNYIPVILHLLAKMWQIELFMKIILALLVFQKMTVMYHK